MQKPSTTNASKSLSFVFTALLLLAFSFSGLAQSNTETTPQGTESDLIKVTPMPPLWSYTLINTIPNQWGFNICKDRVVVINNKVVPGLESIIWYEGEQIAIQVADYILRKIEAEGYPLKPITQSELLNAGIILNPKN